MQDKINEDINTALKAGEHERVEVLRFIKSAIQNETIAQRKDLSDEEVQKVLKRELKKRTEAAQLYRKGGSEERASKEETEAKIIEAYLPEQMSEEEIKQLVDEAVEANPMAGIGQLTGQVIQKSGGQADGAVVSRLVREKLNQL